SGDQALQYKTLRIDAGEVQESAAIVRGGVISRRSGRKYLSLDIHGKTQKVSSDAVDNDVRLHLFDLTTEDCDALIGKLIQYSRAATGGAMPSQTVGATIAALADLEYF